MRTLTLLLLATTALALPISPALAQPSVEAFYKGRTVELVVGTLPGGGYDLYGRLIARYLGRHIPGAPTVIVRNMPGAGHLRMANQNRWARSRTPGGWAISCSFPGLGPVCAEARKSLV